MGIADRLAGVVDSRAKARFQIQASRVRDVLVTMEDIASEDLLRVTDDLRLRYRQGSTLDDLLPAAFAACCAAAHKTVGLTYRNTQVVAGAALHAGMVVDMKTGEGKTLAAVLPAYLNALTGRGVHIATANAYLAERDAHQMGQIYRTLGLTCGAVLPTHDRRARQLSYAADVTYGTATEFGFDYLRDHMVYEASDVVHRPTLHYIIVDEADSVLVDEASTPLIINSAAPGDTSIVRQLAGIVSTWTEGLHYQVDRELWTAWPEDAGLDDAAARLQVTVSDLHSPGNPYISALHNAVKALSLYRRGAEYLVDDGEVHVIDTHTGRILPGRRYHGGLHQAIEAKEQVPLQQESTAQATTAIHNYLRLYQRMAGMTGTTVGLERELRTVYGTDVVRVPTFKEVQRVTPQPRIYATDKAQRSALADDVLSRVAAGQPVLVGTNTVAESVEVANLLRSRGLDPRVLNAATPRQEAAIISRAGLPGQVTVATNMAGRGTDILLGGEPTDVGREIAAFQCDAVISVGGLCVIGTALNISTRVDEQLKGRCARQGDPGIAYFYYSFDDERLLDNSPSELPDVHGDKRLSHSYVRYFRAAQEHAAAASAQAREQTRKYDDVLDSQRSTVYAQRDAILTGKSGSDALWDMVTDTLDSYLTEWLNDASAMPDDLWVLTARIWTDMPAYPGDRVGPVRSWITAMFYSRYDTIKKAWISATGDKGWELYVRRILLTCIDEGWKRHLDAVDSMRDVVQLRATAGRDVHIEYATETASLYNEMLRFVRELAAQFVFQNGEPNT